MKNNHIIKARIKNLPYLSRFTRNKTGLIVGFYIDEYNRHKYQIEVKGFVKRRVWVSEHELEIIGGNR